MTGFLLFPFQPTPPHPDFLDLSHFLGRHFFTLFRERGLLLKQTTGKKLLPYSNLSTGGHLGFVFLANQGFETFKSVPQRTHAFGRGCQHTRPLFLTGRRHPPRNFGEMVADPSRVWLPTDSHGTQEEPPFEKWNLFLGTLIGFVSKYGNPPPKWAVFPLFPFRTPPKRRGGDLKERHFQVGFGPRTT